MVNCSFTSLDTDVEGRLERQLVCSVFQGIYFTFKVVLTAQLT